VRHQLRAREDDLRPRLRRGSRTRNLDFQRINRTGTLGYLEGYYYKPRIDWQLREVCVHVAQHNTYGSVTDGLIPFTAPARTGRRLWPDLTLSLRARIHFHSPGLARFLDRS
jgi:hypothetical protein